MKTPENRIGGGGDLDFLLPEDLTPDQAEAVCRSIDTLRDWLWSRYGEEIQDYCREHYVTTTRSDPGDPPL